MNIKPKYIYIISAYIVVLLYVLLDNNIFVTSALFLMLAGYHISSLTGVMEKLFQDKEDSVIKLQHQLSKTEQVTQSTYQQFISLSKTLGSGVMMVNGEGYIDFANKDIEEYFSINFNEQDYKSLLDVKPLYKFVNEAYLLEKSKREQIEFNDHFFDLISTPIFDHDMFQGNLIIVHDITLLKTAEQFQKQFTADVSHELKTPLSSIKGFSELIRHNKDMPEKDREEFIALIHDEATRMEQILNDLIIISRLDRLDYELNLEPVEIKDIITEASKTLEHRYQEKGIELTLSLESCIINVDKTKIRQVFLNLVKNALNYTDEGEVTITGKKLSNSYEVKVVDTGIGVKPQDYERIFKRFYRVDKARSRETGGSGLGLSITKNVLAKHGGTISVESDGKTGTVFTVTIPITNS